MTQLSLIAAAVAPLKIQAHARATIEARKIISRTVAELQAAGWDRNAVAPYPRACWGNDYHAKLAKARMVASLTQSAQSSHRPGEPVIVTISLWGAAHFIREAQENAAAQYDSYVAKLEQKIGEVTEAKLVCDMGVWGRSTLIVTTAAGERQNWLTQMIVNVSKLGKLFNQFPTRRLKRAA